MFFKQIHGLITFSRLLKLLIGLAVGVQIIVITYNHLSGYYVLDNTQHFILRLFRGSVLSLFAGFLISYPDLFFIRYLNHALPWGSKSLKRISLQLLFTLGVAVLISILITFFAHVLSPYKEPLLEVLITNALIYSVVNIIMMAILEAWLFFLEGKEARQMAENLREELSQIKFEVLKSQINPHFLFNSLNVLSGLINKDTAKAQLFIDEFSQIYRYVLETIEQPVVSLAKELEFTRSYLFLQQIRYGENLRYSLEIPSGLLALVLPPLSLQMVLENAIKHNIINEAKPLLIEMFTVDSTLVVRNNIQPKISKAVSTGLGLKNLVKRYALISGHIPVFTMEAEYFVVVLPLIEIDDDEGTDH